MKTVLRLAGSLALLGLLACSCSKDSMGQMYGGTIWYGYYIDLNHTFSLSFSDDGQKCSVFKEIAGSAEERFEYEVHWSSRNSFQLQKTGQSIVYYSGILAEDEMILDEYSNGQMTHCYTLSQDYLPIIYISSDSTGATGELYDGTAWYGKRKMMGLSLAFEDGGQKCRMQPMDLNNKHDICYAPVTFDVQWPFQNSFILLVTTFDGQTSVHYSGVISEKKMLLYYLQDGQVTLSCELTKKR